MEDKTVKKTIIKEGHKPKDVCYDLRNDCPKCKIDRIVETKLMANESRAPRPPDPVKLRELAHMLDKDGIDDLADDLREWADWMERQ